ncbi:J domain-containing protein [Streptomyces sp. NPDC006193]|uniref:J domain-containing protein n=1 Tax=Streptomyces sp. NPDC006193 TaxID=3155717 RepID=UPI0033B485F9
MREPDLYAVLGVEPSATTRAIISAFRRRARELRPDTRVDAVTAARFGSVTAAYETLRDPVRRAAYDRARRRPSRGPAGLAQPDRPARGHPVVPGAAAPEPPLRAGPVHWEPGGRTTR